MQDFQKLDVWKKAHSLTLQIYTMTNEFPEQEKFGLTSQIQRAVISVESNIAEGCGRDSNADLARFLHIASGSISEVKCQLILAKDLLFIERAYGKPIFKLACEVQKMLHGLIAKLKTDN